MLQASRFPEAQSAPTSAEATLTLPFDLRSRSRLRAKLDDGRDVAVFLPRGELLRGGDLLLAEGGTTTPFAIAVRAAPEPVSTAHAAAGNDQALMLSRVCYHLGNRHVALQIGAGWVRYLHDHVLDDMVRALGLEVRMEEAPFEPEPGAYGEAAHLDHGHGQGHIHVHGGEPHSHGQGPAHRHAHGHSHD